MEDFQFLHSRNRFYKTDTKSKIPLIQTNMSEVGNNMENNYQADCFPLKTTWQEKECYAAQPNRIK